MPLQPEPNLQQENPKEIVILQINLNKSEKKKGAPPKNTLRRTTGADDDGRHSLFGTQDKGSVEK
jgi:hypothetical protein